MYLHLGQSVVVPYRDVIGLFDLDNTTSSHITRAALERAEREGKVVNVGEDLPKSFVICRRSSGRRERAGNTIVYLCQLSTATLLRRAESGGFEGSEGR